MQLVADATRGGGGGGGGGSGGSSGKPGSRNQGKGWKYTKEQWQRYNAWWSNGGEAPAGEPAAATAAGPAAGPARQAFPSYAAAAAAGPRGGKAAGDGPGPAALATAPAVPASQAKVGQRCTIPGRSEQDSKLTEALR